MSNLKVGALGAEGKVGSTICETVEAADGLELAAGLDSGSGPNELVTTDVQTTVDLTQPDSVVGNLRFCIKNGINTVAGTTGLTKERLGQVRRWFDDADGGTNVLIAPNFAISAALTMGMAEFATSYFDSAEVIEMYHPFKGNASSGTAIHTAEAITRARREVSMEEQPDAIEQTLDGARGAEVEGIPVHAVRMTGSVVHEAIIFGAEGQPLTTKQDSYSRTSFVPGVLLDARKIEDFPGLTVGLEPFLGL